MAFGQWWIFIEAVEGPIGRDRGALPFHPEGQMAARRADLAQALELVHQSFAQLEIAALTRARGAADFERQNPF